MDRIYQALYTVSFVVSERMQTLKENEKGASAVEYGLLAALIAGIILTITAVFGPELKAKFDSIL